MEYLQVSVKFQSDTTNLQIRLENGECPSPVQHVSVCVKLRKVQIPLSANGVWAHGAHDLIPKVPVLSVNGVLDEWSALPSFAFFPRLDLAPLLKKFL